MIFAANWKMNKNPLEAADYIRELRTLVAPSEESAFIIFPPMLDLAIVHEGLKGTAVKWGAQNCHWQNSGAFTGETSPADISGLGGSHCLVGHSERRHLFSETDDQIARKVKAIQLVGLTPMLCVGETLDERQTGRTESVIEAQLRANLQYADFQLPLTIAYEPVWAIGTGKVATSEQANQVHRFIREWLKGLNPGLATTPILYGGSVKPDNAGELSRQPEIDGFLIGGASLEAKSLVAIFRAAQGPK